MACDAQNGQPEEAPVPCVVGFLTSDICARCGAPRAEHTPPPAVPWPPQALRDVEDALREALAYFERRDRMNAVVHLGEVRWSPITDLVRAAKETLSDDYWTSTLDLAARILVMSDAMGSDPTGLQHTAMRGVAVALASQIQGPRDG